jgi:hypothetical protein
MAVSSSLLAELLHLPIGVWVTGAEWSHAKESLVLTLEGDVPAEDGMYLTPVVTHVDDYLWDWKTGGGPLARGAAPK